MSEPTRTGEAAAIFTTHGVLDAGEIPADQRMHVQRLDRGVYVVRAVSDGRIPELPAGIR